MITYLQRAARFILALELPILALMTFAFWYPSPIRDNWLWLLYLLIPIYAARLLLYRRLLTLTPLTPWMLLYVVLVVFNIGLGLYLASDGAASAPYTRGWVMLGRPLLGLAIFVACVEYARVHGSIRGLITGSIWAAMLLGLLAVGATQWTSKAKQFEFITNALPRIANFPGAEGGFNPNEIAGAMAWVLPLIAGVALYRWRDRLPRRDDVTIAVILVGLGLFLGQSRAALLGVLLGLAVCCWLILRRYWRFVAIGVLFLIGVLQIVTVAFVPLSPESEGDATTGVSNVAVQADESIAPRLRIWQAALDIIRDYPLTGVGISFFRYDPIRSRYPVADVELNILVHTHNEWLQIGTDFGIPGMLVYLSWYVAAAFTLRSIWKKGDGEARAVGLAIGCGLLAHAVFGLVDAIPLSDRFAFLHWWMLGLLGAQYVVTEKPAEPAVQP